MADEAATTTTDTTTATTTQAAAWHAEITDPELRGYVENRGLAGKTALAAFVETAKAHRAAEAHLGVPAERLLRLPADQNPDAWKEVWGRLGAPDNPEGYDLSGVKFADGTDLDPEFAAFFRTTAAANHLPKDAAVKLAADFTRYVEAQTAAEKAAEARQTEEAKAALKTNWGANFEANLGTARQAMLALKPTEEQVDALEKTFGYDKVMEFFRSVGEKMGEDTFVQGNGGRDGASQPRTVDGARERMTALMNDKEWLARYSNGGVKEAQEFWALHRQANPEAYAAATA